MQTDVAEKQKLPSKREEQVSGTQAGALAGSTASGQEYLLKLQQSHGNAYVQRLIAGTCNAGATQRVAGRGNSPARRVHRSAHKMTAYGMGSSSGPSTITLEPVWGRVISTSPDGPVAGGFSYLDFASPIENFTIPEDVTAGRIEMHVFESADINNILINDVQ